MITDIDAAVFDVTTGELGLFQLKWQDFSSSDVAKQRSKAGTSSRRSMLGSERPGLAC